MNSQIIRYGVAAGIGLAVGALGGYIGGVLRTRKIFMRVVETEIQNIHTLNVKEREELTKYRVERYGPTQLTDEEVAGMVASPTDPSQVLITTDDIAGLGLDSGISIEGTVVENVTVEAVRKAMGGQSSITLEDLKAHMAEQGLDHFAVSEDAVGQRVKHAFEVDQEAYQAQAPRHIRIDQFMDDDEGAAFNKISLTLYELDGILATEDQITIDDIDATIGVEHLQMFGRESDDPDVVYVRSPKVSTDYEIRRRTTSYQVEILNMSPQEAGIEGFTPGGSRGNG